MLERRTKVGIVFEQSPRDAVPDRARLARWATAGNVDDEVKLICGLSQLQRLANNHSQRFVREVAIERFVINFHFARAGSQLNSGSCRFATPGSVILNFSHSYSSSLFLLILI